VAISGDGSTLVVRTAPAEPDLIEEFDAAVLCVFRRVAATWELEHELAFDANPYSARTSLALSQDGDTLVTDTGNNGAIHVFERHGASWSEPSVIWGASPGGFGAQTSVAISNDGQTIALAYTGAIQRVLVLRRAGVWALDGELTSMGSDDQFGASVAMTADGQTIAVGAPMADISIDGPTPDLKLDVGAVYVFVREPSGWVQQFRLERSNGRDDDSFGAAIALSGDGRTLVANAPETGSVYMFRNDGSNAWSEAAEIPEPLADSHFGESMALSAKGEVLAIGAWGESGAVHAY
jgi:hypothetical protein